MVETLPLEAASMTSRLLQIAATLHLTALAVQASGSSSSESVLDQPLETLLAESFSAVRLVSAVNRAFGAALLFTAALEDGATLRSLVQSSSAAPSPEIDFIAEATAADDVLFALPN
jgi:hypothetical protein